MAVRYTVARVMPDHFSWLVDRTGLVLTVDFTAVAVLNPDQSDLCPYCNEVHPRIRAMVGYSNVTPSSAHLHLAVEHPAAYRAIQAVALPLLFEVGDKEVGLAQVRASNERIQKLVEHEGFRKVATVPGAYQRSEDILIYRLDRKDWRERGNPSARRALRGRVSGTTDIAHTA